MLQRGRILRGESAIAPLADDNGVSANAQQHAVRIASRVGLVIRRTAEAEAEAVVDHARNEATRIDARTRKRCEDSMRSLERTLAHIADRYETRLYERESRLVDLALSVAERIVLVQQEERFAEIARAYVREGLRSFGAARAVRVRISAEVAKLLPLDAFVSERGPGGMQVNFEIDEHLDGLDVAVDADGAVERLSVRERTAAAVTGAAG